MKARNMVLVIAVVLTIGVTYVLRAVNPPEPAQPGIGTNVALLGEDLSRIDNGGGRYSLIYQKDQNYVKNGVVFPYDLTIRASEVPGFAYEIDNEVRVLLSGTSDGAYRIEHEGDYAEFSLENISSPVSGAITEGAMRFNNAFPYTDVIRTPLNLGLKETVVLKSSAASHSMATRMRTNLTPEPLPDGSIVLMREGAPVFNMLAPSALDANGVPFRAVYTLAPAGNDYMVTLSVDTDSAGVSPAYPVEIDPTITFNDSSTIKDATISGDATAFGDNYGGTTYLVTGFYNGANTDSDRTLIEFPSVADSLPLGAVVTSAKLKLYCYLAQNTNSSFNIQMYKITKDWDEGNQTPGPGYCNWVYAKSGVAWSTLGGDFGEKIDTTCHVGSASIWYEFNVMDAVLDWVDNPDSNYGILLKDSLEGSGSSETDQNRHGFRSSEYGTTSLRPQLVIEYYIPPPHIKYSSDYGSLQEAVDSTRSGDMLFIDEDYTLTSTVEIRRPHVTIIGTKCVIQPQSNGSPSPLFRIVNAGQDSLICNLSIGNIRFMNTIADTTEGIGTAIEIYGDTSVANGEMYGVKLEDLYIFNFEKGIHLKNSHNILVENCMVSYCDAGLKTENTISGGGTGEIKVHGGYFFGNTAYHIHHSAGTISLFNWTCGSGYTSTIGIYSDSSAAINAFCCHFEGLAYAIKSDADSTPSINAFANDFEYPINNTGIYVKTKVNNISAIGNHLGLTGTQSGKPWIHVPSVLEGMLIGGNDYSPYSTIDSTAGLVEYTAIDTIVGNVPAFRIPYMPGAELPTADKFVKGTMIFLSDSNKVKISDGTNWINLN